MLVFYWNRWHADSSTIITDNQFQKKLIQTIQIFREIIFRKDAFKLFYIDTKALYVKQMFLFIKQSWKIGSAAALILIFYTKSAY